MEVEVEVQLKSQPQLYAHKYKRMRFVMPTNGISVPVTLSGDVIRGCGQSI